MATQSESKSNELIPPEGDKDVGFQVFRVLEEILKDKERLGLPKKWQRNYELSRNKHWKGAGNAKVQLVSANLLHDHRQKTVSKLTDNNPTFNVATVGAPGEVSEEMKDDLLHLTEYWWNEQEQQSILEESVITGEIYGCTVEKVAFNPDLEFGMGEVETELVDPYHFGFFPVKAKSIQKAEAVLHYYPISVREARRMWPAMAKQIQADQEYLKELGDQRRELAGGNLGGSYFATFRSVVRQILNTALSSDECDETLVVECWVKDRTSETVSMKMVENDVEIDVEVERPVYPGYIRCVTCCNGGAVVLSDRQNPSINSTLPDDQAAKTYLYDKFPFSLTPSITDPLIPWGMSDFEQLEQLQVEINKTISQITLYKDKASRLKVINPKDSGVPNAHFTNYPGVLNPTSGITGQGIRYMDPPRMPVDLPQNLEIYKSLFFQISGGSDMEQAQSQGRQVIAYKAIAELHEKTNTLLSTKIRNYGKMIRERGRMFLSHVMNWYAEDRWITYQDDGQEISKQVNGMAINVPVKLTVVSGSTMPKSRVQEREEALDLFSKGAIDAEELLKKLDWSNRKAVIQRMKEGPYGQLYQKMSAMGMPQEILQYVQQVATMDDKEFAQAEKRGEVPQIGQMLQQMAMSGMGQQQVDPLVSADLNIKTGELKKLEAEANKIQSEINLIMEKANTERVNQQVAIAGVQFDKKKLDIETAQTLNAIEHNKHQRAMGAADKVMQMGQQGADNAAKNGPPESQFSGATGRTHGQGPFRDKGMVSDNKTQPGREFGGPVEKDQPYTVGEGGPETFVPDQSGQIMPNVKDIVNKNMDKDFVKRMADVNGSPVLSNADGSYSTQRMSWATVGKDQTPIVYPEVIRDPNNPNSLIQLPPDQAIQHAMKSGEYITFPTGDQADWFTRNYKKQLYNQSDYDTFQRKANENKTQ